MEKFNFELWLSVALGLYEVLSRVIKTSKVWSIIGNVLKLLVKVSESLDRKKK